MISELRVRDLATVADVRLELGDGLNVLTGETGAGKSMLVDALALLLGERADSATVRTGARKALVEGAVDGIGPLVARRLEALGLDGEDDRLIIRREVSVEGRSRAWINGSPCTVSALAEVGALVVDLHGQHETQSLLKPSQQRQILDAYAGAEADSAAVAEAHAALAGIRDAEQALAQRRDEVRRRADYLRHVVSEIDAARLVPGGVELHRLAPRSQCFLVTIHDRQHVAEVGRCAAIVCIRGDCCSQYVDLFYAMRKDKRRIALHAQRELRSRAIVFAGFLIEIAERVVEHRMNATLIDSQDA